MCIRDRNIKVEIASLPGVYRFSADKIMREIESCIKLGIQSFILFPKVKGNLKDAQGTYAWDEKNFYLKAAKKIKKKFPNITLISDVALDPYSSDGHDGYVYKGKIENDLTLPLLQKMAIAQAHAGFDILGPSDMMDGRIQAIRIALEQNGFKDTGIMSYTAKYASAFYGPFRDALDSAPVKTNNIPRNKKTCLLYTSPSPRDATLSRMPSSA